MKVEFRKGVDGKILKLVKELEKAGMMVEWPPEITLDGTEIHPVGRLTPAFIYTVKGRINFRIPESLVEVKKE